MRSHARRYVDGALYLSECASEGLIQHVGVTNFDVPRMEAMTKAGVRIASNQVGLRPPHTQMRMH